jgi:hypothetical protein
MMVVVFGSAGSLACPSKHHCAGFEQSSLNGPRLNGLLFTADFLFNIQGVKKRKYLPLLHMA